MSLNSKIILGFLIAGIILGAIGTKLFIIPLIFFPLWIIVTDNGPISTVIEDMVAYSFWIFIGYMTIGLGLLVFILYGMATLYLVKK